MRSQLQLGLVAEGNSTESAVLRLPNLAEELGPVKSSALRVARRLCNFLRAGYAISEYQDLRAARLILLRVPDPAVSRIVDEICKAELIFKELSFVLCESWLLSDVLEPLRKLGASVATLVAARTSQRKWFVVEGGVTAVRQARKLIERNGARALELHPDAKHLYFAADLLATALPQPLLLAAQQSLRLSGISGKHLHGLLDELGGQMFNSFLKGARARWGGPLAECPPETVQVYLDALRRKHPEIAELIDKELPIALHRMTGRTSI